MAPAEAQQELDVTTEALNRAVEHAYKVFGQALEALQDVRRKAAQLKRAQQVEEGRRAS